MSTYSRVLARFLIYRRLHAIALCLKRAHHFLVSHTVAPQVCLAVRTGQTMLATSRCFKIFSAGTAYQIQSRYCAHDRVVFAIVDDDAIHPALLAFCFWFRWVGFLVILHPILDGILNVKRESINKIVRCGVRQKMDSERHTSCVTCLRHASAPISLFAIHEIDAYCFSTSRIASSRPRNIIAVTVGAYGPRAAFVSRAASSGGTLTETIFDCLRM